MRRGAEYTLGENDDVLTRENDIHRDIDMRLAVVEEAVEAAAAGNRVDLDLLIVRYNETVAGLGLRVEQLLDLTNEGFSASVVKETATRLFLTPDRRKAILDEIRGPLAEGIATLADLHTIIQSYATPTDVAEAVATITDNAPAGRDTFGKLSAVLDTLAAKVTAITAGVSSDRDTFKEVSDLVDTLTLRVSAITAGAPASRDTFAEVSSAIDTVAAAVDAADARVTAILAGAPASRDTFAEVSSAIDAVASAVAAITAGSVAARDTLREVSDAVDTTNARVTAILAGAPASRDTFAEVSSAIDTVAAAVDAADARVTAILAGAPASRDTFAEVSSAIDAVASAVAAITAGSVAARDTLKEVSDAVDTTNARVTAILAGAPASRDTFAEVSSAIDAVASAVAAITAGSDAARDTLKEVSDAVDAVAASVAALTAGASASRDTFVEVGTALDALTAALGLRLRVDATQGLTDAQKEQAIANVGLVDRYVRADGANSGQFGSRNKFVNGNFEVWQRGVSFPAGNYDGKYICDMVQVLMNGTGATMSFDRLTDNDGAKPRLRCQTVSVPTNATFNILRFCVEGARTFAGKRVAVSFTVQKYGTGANVPLAQDVTMRQYFGTGGSPSSQVTCTRVSAPADSTITATEKRLTYVFDVPSVSARTFGTNGDDYLYWYVYLPINTAFKALIGEMQIEDIGTAGGNVAAPFECHTPADYLAMCQRYYEKSYAPDEAPGTLTFNGALTQRAQAATSLLSFGSTRFASVKRAVPAVTLYSPTTGATAAPVRNAAANTDLAAAVAAIGAGGFAANVNAAVAAGDGVQTHWTADASY